MSSKKITFQHLASLFKVLSCENRLLILDYLIEHGTASNKQLTLALGCSQSTISENLSKLVANNMVEVHQRGPAKFYRINTTLLQNFNLLSDMVEEAGKM